MIDFAAEHVGFVVVSYGIVTLVLAGLVLRAVLRARTLKNALSAQGLSDPGQKDGAT
jgi:heme exporter protein CcmD